MSEQEHKPALVIEARELCKEYLQGSALVRVLDGVDLPVAAGERIVVLGRFRLREEHVAASVGGLDRPVFRRGVGGGCVSQPAFVECPRGRA